MNLNIEGPKDLNLNGKIVFSAKCSQSHTSTLACNNPSCKQQAFVCSDKTCYCRSNHKKCLFTCPDQILEMIEEKRSESKEVIEKISNAFERWIDQISRTRQTIQDILLNWGLSMPQKQFIEMIKTSQYKRFTGSDINRITSSATSYFEQEVKQKILNQISIISVNHDAEIKHMLKSCVKLFDKYQLSEIIVDNEQEKNIQTEFDFMEQIKQYRNEHLSCKGQKFTRQEYNRTMQFFKETIKKSFQNHMCSYKKQRRAYGSRKLRQNHMNKYLSILLKFKVHMTQWQQDTSSFIKQLNTSMQTQLKGLSEYYRQSQSNMQFPFTVDMALQFQRALNVIQMMIKLIKQKGKQLIRPLVERNIDISERSHLLIYFLDQLMESHPQIDEIEVIWVCVRFHDKVKDQINFLYQTIDEAIKDPVIVEIIKQ